MTTQIFENNLFELEVKIENGESMFDVEKVAKSLGFVEEKNGKEYVRWRTVNGYLRKYLSQDVAKNDFISEPMVYKLAFKANNNLAEQFQDWLAVEVLPAIRKNGLYVADLLPTDPMEILKLTFEAQNQTNEKVMAVENRVANLEENTVLGAGDYGYIARRINQRVSEIAKGFGSITPDQRGKLYKDINHGVKEVTGVSTRTQLREKHYQTVLEYINDWEPSTATKMQVRQMSLDLETA